MSKHLSVLEKFKPRHEFFVGVDSDGCVFDTMELKHKECFIPAIVREWGLQAVSKYTREAAEFVNLYSRWRGVNRFPALVKVFELLRRRPQVAGRGVMVPDDGPLIAWIERERLLGNPALEREVGETGDPVLQRALTWSKVVNEAVAAMVSGVAPFPYVRESLEVMAARAGVLVVSATPVEALTKEWNEHNLAELVQVIAGQEMGPKKDHIGIATAGRYAPGKVLMIGDAPGDHRAATANAALFYPICPGDEEASWVRFHEEALGRFFAGSFSGEYQESLLADFYRRLPEQPLWEQV